MAFLKLCFGDDMSVSWMMPCQAREPRMQGIISDQPPARQSRLIVVTASLICLIFLADSGGAAAAGEQGWSASPG